MLVTDVINRASTTLQDLTNTRWSKDELLNYLNDAQKAIVNRRPDANIVESSHLCVDGARQSLPSDGITLVDVTRNTNGSTIRFVDKSILDNQFPDWHVAQGSTPIELYSYNHLVPNTFYLYPAPKENNSVDITYSAVPDTIQVSDWSDPIETITLGDQYLNPILDWVLFRAYSKDADYSSNAQRAQMHLEAFRVAIGDKTQADSAPVGG